MPQSTEQNPHKCPNCGAPMRREGTRYITYVCRSLFDKERGVPVQYEMCEYAAGLRRERDYYKRAWSIAKADIEKWKEAGDE